MTNKSAYIVCELLVYISFSFPNDITRSLLQLLKLNLEPFDEVLANNKQLLATRCWGRVEGHSADLWLTCRLGCKRSRSTSSSTVWEKGRPMSSVELLGCLCIMQVVVVLNRSVNITSFWHLLNYMYITHCTEDHHRLTLRQKSYHIIIIM